MWVTDRDGKIINVPEGVYDHSMDALRYAISNMLKKKTSSFDHDAFLLQEL
jgi:hypothetical protein